MFTIILKPTNHHILIPTFLQILKKEAHIIIKLVNSKIF